MTSQRIIAGDCIEGMRTLPDASVHCCITSPPYWGLRDYGHEGQIGLESTPDAYVARMVEVFREVRRVLREDGTCWVNLGDSYAAAPAGKCSNPQAKSGLAGVKTQDVARQHKESWNSAKASGLKQKDLVGIPWRVAFALQADGWWLRQDIIWHKPNPMPESVRDRCTKAHEYVFLLTKSERYWYDAEAVSEAVACVRGPGNRNPLKGVVEDPKKHATRAGLHKAAERWRQEGPPESRNRRSVWTVTTKPYSGAHFAVMPPDLVEPCIKAGCPEGGTVLDPFAGSGTTLAVAAELGRSGIGCELNPEYIQLAEQRIKDARASVALFEGVPA
jgi:site-specific DNA-methyltransferase (adenine-specific)